MQIPLFAFKGKEIEREKKTSNIYCAFSQKCTGLEELQRVLSAQHGAVFPIQSSTVC